MMAELTRDDIRQAVRDEMANTLNDIRTIRDIAQRLDQRTNDLDNTQREVRDLYQRLQNLMPQVDAISGKVQAGAPVQNTQDIQDTKLRVQNIEKGIAQIVQYLQTQSAARDDDEGYRSA